MRCTCYCTAASYDLPPLFHKLRSLGAAQTFREVVHIHIKQDRQTKGHLFYFNYGVLVCWGFTEREEKNFLNSLKEFEKEPLAKPELDEFSYAYGSTVKIDQDRIFLHNKNALTKLAVSYGIAQSVKLSTFEDLTRKTTDSARTIPMHLAKRGKISLSRKQISRMMGEIFLERSFINLHSEMLDVPEFFWNRPELEPYYRRAAHYLDVIKRVEVLNKRLNVMHDLFEILSSEWNHKHTSRLEIIIVLLIFLELAVTLLRDLFHAL